MVGLVVVRRPSEFSAVTPDLRTSVGLHYTAQYLTKLTNPSGLELIHCYSGGRPSQQKVFSVNNLVI